MKSILLAHAEKYPLMEPTDAVKLIYQSEFGGGHLIKNPADCLRYLHQEYAATPQKSCCPLTEDIGNGFIRVNLAALDAYGLSPDRLGEIFLQSAMQSYGNPDSFRKKLAILEELTETMKMPFSSEALQAYLTAYEAAGFPPVSHSSSYRNAYHPAYRVIKTEYLPAQVE